MQNDRCDAIRDLLPESTAGLLDATDADDVDAHLATCADCAAESEVVAAMRMEVVRVPAGLEQRIASELARSVPALGWVRPMAIAAAATFALITGGLLVRSQGNGTEAGASEVAASVTPAWPAVQDRLLRVTPVLHDLSVEELESLLEELES